MKHRPLLFSLLVVALLVAAGATPEASPRAHDEQDFDSALLGTWAIDFKVPVSPKGNDFGQPHRHQFKFSDGDDGHTVVAKEVFDVRVPGAWRAKGSEFSATFEFTCPEGVICGTVIMRGLIESDDRMTGRVIVFWDERDDTTPTGLDTVTGTFTGEKCSGRISPSHDTGGCD
jgi:hypothetical protein